MDIEERQQEIKRQHETHMNVNLSEWTWRWIILMLEERENDVLSELSGDVANSIRDQTHIHGKID